MHPVVRNNGLLTYFAKPAAPHSAQQMEAP